MYMHTRCLDDARKYLNTLQSKMGAYPASLPAMVAVHDLSHGTHQKPSHNLFTFYRPLLLLCCCIERIAWLSVCMWGSVP